MTARIRLLLLAVAGLSVFTISLAVTTPAYADDEAPPQEAPAAESAPAGEARQSAPPAAEEASEAEPETDPMWCPAGVTPGSGSCTINHPTFAALLGDPIFAGGGPAVSGVIWVRDNYLGADVSNIHIDGAALTNAKNYALTIRGGWTGLGTAVNTATPSLIDVSLTISAWNGAVTLKDLTISGASSNANCAGFTAPTAALCIKTSKLLTLERVHVDSNVGGLGGAIVDYSTSPGVVIKSSTFTNNSWYGLYVQSFGPITLTDVTAESNATAYGAYLYNASAPTPMNVTLNGTNRFNYNGNGAGGDDFGLRVWTVGAISIRNIVASANWDHGVWLDNSTGATARAVTVSGFADAVFNGDDGLRIQATGVVTLSNVHAVGNGRATSIDNRYLPGTAVPGVYLKGVNTFAASASGDGLVVRSDGPIALSQVTAHDNYGFGVDLQNTTASTPQNVTITGFLAAEGNASTGLLIVTHGAVSAANLTARWNQARGVQIMNAAAAIKPVTLTGRSLFSHNGYEGLKVESQGAVTLNNLTVLWNGCDDWSALPCASAYSGAQITNDILPGVQQNVSLLGQNVFSHNTGRGLSVVSFGTVTLNNITSTGNASDGTFVNNTGGATARPVLINGINLFSENNNSGLSVESFGAVTLNNITSTGNAYDGTFVDNTGGATAQPVLINGVNLFSENNSSGLFVESFGAITVSKITSAANGAYGAWLNNYNPTFQSNVTVSGFGVFEHNAYTGLYVEGHGAFTGANLSANDNNEHGVYIDIAGLTGPKSVSITGVNTFNVNGSGSTQSGLYVLADGNITVSNLTANNNYYDGAMLDNYGNWGPFARGSVTINGYGVFVGNLHDDGLYVRSPGNVVLNRVRSSLNDDVGIYVSTQGNLTIVCSLAAWNGSFGIDGAVDGNLTVKGLALVANGANDTIAPYLVVQGASSVYACP